MKAFISYFHVSAHQNQPSKSKKHRRPANRRTDSTAPLGALAGARLDSTATVRSTPSSLYPVQDRHHDLRCEIMVNWLYQQQSERAWATNTPGEGAILKKGKDLYTCYPPSLAGEDIGLVQAVNALNVRVAITVNTRVIKLLLQQNETPYIPLPGGLHVQIIPSISHLPRCQKHQFAAFIADTELLLVWDDEPRHVLERANHLNELMMEMVWQQTPMGTDGLTGDDDKDAEMYSADSIDLEAGDIPEPRPRLLYTPIYVGMTLTLIFAAIGMGYRAVAEEIAIDHSFLRLLLFIVSPLQLCLSLFFFQIICTNLGQLFGPVYQMAMNSKFYSGKKPQRIHREHGYLPHVTIQCPVYKEGLAAVIEPTVMSLKAAISTYEMQGGSANIFINDDGMQLISEEQAQERIDFYDEHNIGWVARPPHNPTPKKGEKPFLRRGKFKKASNMNYALMISNRVEDKLIEMERSEKWTQEEEDGLYKTCLKQVMAEEEGKAWAEGNIRVGDYILLVDSDTRIPSDCLLDAVSEMELCPEVAVLQYSCGVMQVAYNYFENGITWFTNLIYSAIRFSAANGDVSPFVGHNAFLRWSAVQEIKYNDEDSYEKYWSEYTVSEDFDMSLRLQCAGYTIRLAAYAGEGFKEGVSLTVYDELIRWEKYAYGCSELIFHPFKEWFRKGIFTPLFKSFIMSRTPISSKCTIMAYVCTYYAIASAWWLTLLNYFLMGWFRAWVDKYYMDSFKVYFSLIVVFTAMGNIALAVLRYRISEKSILGALYENFKWVFLMTTFLGGISMHVFQTIVSHMLSIDVTWGATAKEVENTTFFQEVPKLFKRFRWTFIFCFLCTAMMSIFATSLMPVFWQIDVFVAIFPLAMVVAGHLLCPIVLNPSLMLMTW